ncbi:ABC transporter permease [Frisingicoccus sp.]|uniref:ABC transporter permease n=1 Tax=Frisingicoccus sp. TaxID=1918627 RepID=UPI00301E6A08
MIRYCVQRLLSAIPVLIGISLIAFILGLLTPGDPAMMALSRDGMSEVTTEMIEAKREELGLNDSFPVQYGRWLFNALQGDLGRSYSDNTQVSGELLRRLPVTLQLSACSLILVIIFGIAGGILSAAEAGKAVDSMMKVLTNLMLSFPSFWLAIILIIIFAENLKILPTSGVGGLRYMVLPSVTLAAANIGMTIRLMRSSMLTEFGKQYMLAANAKGIGKVRVLLAHAFPNAVVPVITLIGNYAGGILGGSFIIENIFSLPGIGSYVLSAIHSRDYPVIQGYVLVMGFTYVVISLIIDLLCALAQPKIRLGGKSL